MSEHHKKALQKCLTQSFRELATLLAHCPAAHATQPGAVGSWSVKQAVVHLAAHCHRAYQEMLAAQRGKKLSVLPNCQDAFSAGALALSDYFSFDQALSMWHEAHGRVVDLLTTLEADVFTQESPLGSYLRDGEVARHSCELYKRYVPALEAWLGGM